jgi:hypothetical protein
MLEPLNQNGYHYGNDFKEAFKNSAYFKAIEPLLISAKETLS